MQSPIVSFCNARFLSFRLFQQSYENIQLMHENKVWNKLSVAWKFLFRFQFYITSLTLKQFPRKLLWITLEEMFVLYEFFCYWNRFLSWRFDKYRAELNHNFIGCLQAIFYSLIHPQMFINLINDSLHLRFQMLSIRIPNIHSHYRKYVPQVFAQSKWKAMMKNETQSERKQKHSTNQSACSEFGMECEILEAMAIT